MPHPGRPATADDMQPVYGGVLAVWPPWVSDLRGAPSDHDIADKTPGRLATALTGVFNDDSPE